MQNDKFHSLFLKKTAIFVLAGAIATAGLAVRAADPSHPNIVILLADDLGYGDVQANNPEAKTKTPHLDTLASTGMRFTDGHSSDAVCSPSRYGLLTGRYAWRTTLKKGVLGSSAPLLIAENCDTIASMLQRNGYDTAVVGKWHLGLGKGRAKLQAAPQGIEPGPNQRGFDFSYIIPASLNMGPYIYLENLRPVNGVDNSAAPPSQWTNIKKTGGYPAPFGYDAGPIAPGFDPNFDAHPDAVPRFNHVLPHLTAEAVKCIDRQSASGKPFFLYFAIPAPHTPWLPNIDTAGLTEQDAYKAYIAYVNEVDTQVGRVIETLKKNGQWENTLLVFSSDNGPELRPFDVAKAGYSPAGPFRGMKSELYEGGHRVPVLATWPNHVPAASVTTQIFCLADLYRTIATLVGDQRPDGMTGGEDSVDFSPLFLGKTMHKPADNPLVYHSAHGKFGIRVGDWAYLDWGGSGGYTHANSNPDGTPGQLFNLAKDPSEQHNLYSDNPERVEKMKKILTRIQGDDIK